MSIDTMDKYEEAIGNFNEAHPEDMEIAQQILAILDKGGCSVARAKVVLKRVSGVLDAFSVVVLPGD